eukprot:TRINITY_DN9375_c0_g1_i1.p1 TRINITY_DN9375_c0_g1~~TRINITY_DN9375_c0_g1_i1.p1  ORF type:complete len:153 (+),score=18.93 TRINITY_DN9375_c0_g1_i1:116-574(+)
MVREKEPPKRRTKPPLQLKSDKRDQQPRCYRRAMACQVEILHYQKTTNLLIQRVPFQRFVKQICQEISKEMFDSSQERQADSRGALAVAEPPKMYRFEAQALHALHEAAESFMVGLMEDASLAAVHSKRVTIMPRDLQLMSRLRKSTLDERR